MTDPAGTVVLVACVTALTVRFAPVMALDAAIWVRPTTFGTVTCGGPFETTRLTALPCATCVLAVGDWLITDPAGTVVLDAVVTVPTTRFAPVIAEVAAVCVRPTRFGTATWGGGVDATRISMAARFQRSVVGDVALMVAVDPAFATGAVRACTQNVSITLVSTHSWIIVWPGPRTRGVAPFQSLPTP